MSIYVFVDRNIKQKVETKKKILTLEMYEALKHELIILHCLHEIFSFI